MRNKLLGAIAAATAGAGAAHAQAPGVPPPMPIGPAGMMAEGSGMPGPGPSAMPGPGMMPGGMGGPGMMPSGMGGPGMMPGAMGGMGAPGAGGSGMGGLADMGGEPGYPAGVHGQPQWGSGGGEGLFTAPPGVNSRLAARSWFNLDYLLYFNKSQPGNFPLLTTGAPAGGGIPGSPGTRVLAGDEDFGYDQFSGFRVELGFYVDQAQRRGIYASGFLLEQRSRIIEVASDATGQPLFARPFLNTATGAADVLLISFPTTVAGSGRVYTASRTYSIEGGSWTNLYRSCPDDRNLVNLNLLAGFRYFELYETLRIEQNSSLISGTAVFDGKLIGAPANIGVSDEFEVYNRFYGGNVGLNLEFRRDRLFFNTTAKIAVGVMNERLDTRGFSTLSGTTTGANSVVSGGLYANSQNIGRFNEDRFCVIPEVNFSLGYQVSSWLTANVGYNYLYVSRVARPGDQFNPAVNPNLVPTSPSFGLGAPTAPMIGQIIQSDYWMHGLNFGLTMRY